MLSGCRKIDIQSISELSPSGTSYFLASPSSFHATPAMIVFDTGTPTADHTTAHQKKMAPIPSEIGRAHV